MKLTAPVIGVAAVILLAGCNPEELGTTTITAVTPSPAASATRQPAPPKPSPATTPQPVPVPSAAVTVIRVVDGDTVETSVGMIRLIGIDTPERGQCGYGEATAKAASLAPPGSTITLVDPVEVEDRDKHERFLRYITTEHGQEFGLSMIASGLADARYDSRDGYGAHPKQGEYVAADTAPNSGISCPAPAAPKPTPKPTPTPVKPKPQPGAAAPADPGVYYANCAAARAAGAAPMYLGEPGYRPALDRDKDGKACDQ